MCISHKFADMATFCTFINNWATRSRKTGKELEFVKHSPLFALADRFLKPDQQHNEELVVSPLLVNDSVMQVFSFKGHAITKLRENVMSEDSVMGEILSPYPGKYLDIYIYLVYIVSVYIRDANSGYW
ncbi:putative chloramphenicol acetyltransferase-like domain superfamily [Helianthus anomalus]